MGEILNNYWFLYVFGDAEFCEGPSGRLREGSPRAENIEKTLVFVCFLRFGGCYFHAISGVCVFHSWYRFLDVFLIDLGVILGGSGGSGATIWGVENELGRIYVKKGGG